MNKTKKPNKTMYPPHRYPPSKLHDFKKWDNSTEAAKDNIHAQMFRCRMLMKDITWLPDTRVVTQRYLVNASSLLEAINLNKISVLKIGWVLVSALKVLLILLLHQRRLLVEGTHYLLPSMEVNKHQERCYNRFINEFLIYTVKKDRLALHTLRETAMLGRYIATNLQMQLGVAECIKVMNAVDEIENTEESIRKKKTRNFHVK